MVAIKPSLSDVRDWLDTVPDPENPVISIVDLGIVRDVLWQADQLVVAITPTYSGCPASSVIAQYIVSALRKRGVEDLRIETRLAPAWTTDWLTRKGRNNLEKYGIAPPQPGGGPRRCPRCASAEVTRISQFGSTPCKALWQCRTCLEPFDYFKCI